MNTTIVPTNSNINLVRIAYPSLEVEVKPKKQTITGEIGSGYRRQSPNTYPRVLIVEGKTGPTGHYGIPPIAESIGVDVPQVRCVRGQCLP